MSSSYPTRPDEPGQPRDEGGTPGRADGPPEHDERDLGADRAGPSSGGATARDSDDTAVQPRSAPHRDAPRYDERPGADPDGPGTTFFTNHPDDVKARQKEAYGGVKVGAAFFGWLVTVALLVLLLGLVGAVVAAVGLTTGATGVEDALGGAGLSTAGIVSAVVLGLVLFFAYLGGGYVAGRMARFDGAKQGVAVWVWAVLAAVVLSVVGAVAGSRSGLADQLDTFPGLTLSQADLTTGGIVAALVLVALTLGGAVVGGLLGTGYHRRVDRVGLLHPADGPPNR